MSTRNIDLLYWNYFIALESNLVEISRFIEFSPDNFDTYSIELSHLFLAASSEVDVLCKELCTIVSPSDKATYIEDYRQILISKIPDITTAFVIIPRYSLQITPWKEWSTGKNPQWWIDHNKVKHDRTNNYNRANLENVLNSLSALFIILLFYYKYKSPKIRLDPVPILYTAPRTLVKRDLILGWGVSLHFDEG